MIELNTDLVTVRSLPPLFTSGEPPLEDTFSIKKGGSFAYVVSARDNVPDLNALYRVTAQPQHGVVTQTEVGTFEYRPLAAYIGSDSFKFVACNLDDVCSSDKVIKLNMTDGNQSPKLERMIAPAWNTVAGGLRMSEDATLNDIQLVIDEDNVIESSCGVPNVVVTSGNTSRFPQSATNIEVSGTFPYCKLKLKPAIGSAGLGSTTMTLTLDDLVNPPVVSTFNVNVIEKAPQWAASTAATSYTVNKNSGSHTIQLDPASDADFRSFQHLKVCHTSLRAMPIWESQGHPAYLALSPPHPPFLHQAVAHSHTQHPQDNLRTLPQLKQHPSSTKFATMLHPHPTARVQRLSILM